METMYVFELKHTELPKKNADHHLILQEVVTLLPVEGLKYCIIFEILKYCINFFTKM